MLPLQTPQLAAVAWTPGPSGPERELLGSPARVQARQGGPAAARNREPRARAPAPRRQRRPPRLPWSAQRPEEQPRAVTQSARVRQRSSALIPTALRPTRPSLPPRAPAPSSDFGLFPAPLALRETARRGRGSRHLCLRRTRPAAACYPAGP